MQASSARAFGDSVGVNVHLTYVDTSYRDFDTVSARLQELGVRYVRDGLCATCPFQLAHLNTLAGRGHPRQPDRGGPQGRRREDAREPFGHRRPPAPGGGIDRGAQRARQGGGARVARAHPGLPGRPLRRREVRPRPCGTARARAEPHPAGLLGRDGRPVAAPRSRQLPPVPGRRQAPPQHRARARAGHEGLGLEATGDHRDRLPLGRGHRRRPPARLRARDRRLHPAPRTGVLPGGRRAAPTCTSWPTSGPTARPRPAGSRDSRTGSGSFGRTCLPSPRSSPSATCCAAWARVPRRSGSPGG